MALTLQQKADRMLLLMYLLAGGRKDVPVNLAALIGECDRLKIFEMTVQEFEEFKRKVRKAVAAKRN